MLPCAPCCCGRGNPCLPFHPHLGLAIGSRQSAQQEMASGQEARAAAAAAAAGMLSGSRLSWPLIRARKHVYSARPLAPLSATCQRLVLCLCSCLCVRLVSRPNLLFVCARNFAVLIIYLGGCPRGLDKRQARGRRGGMEMEMAMEIEMKMATRGKCEMRKNKCEHICQAVSVTF